MDVLNSSFLFKLLLLQLFSAALSAAEYRTVIANVAIHSPISLVTDVENECECKAKCWSDSGCTAASYDAVADICSMTDGGPDTVTTRPLLDSVAFFKYHFTETPLEVFLTSSTLNGSLANQRVMCAAQNGVPLIIKTQLAKDQAMKLTREIEGAKQFGTSVYESWMSARHCKSAEPKTECRWPDGSSLYDAIFTDQDVTDAFSPGPATVFQESGSILAILDNPVPYHYPVLCSRNLN